ncbi:MAG: class I SAM-dependent methyltransferase [Acuticoccus sp.]
MTSAVNPQIWSSTLYEKNARFVSDLGRGVFDLLAPRKGERILDLGCGDGVLTEEIAATGALVEGIDHSTDFVASARARGLDAHLGDGEALAFDRQFDAVFCNAALHWMTNGERVIDGVFRALKPGGRFAAEFGGHGNIASIITALVGLGRQHGIDPALAHPWFFPTPQEYAEMLEARGFAVESIALIARPTLLPTGMRGWVETFRKPFFRAAGPRAEALLDELEAVLAPSLLDTHGNWIADYVRLRVLARRPEEAS